MNILQKLKESAQKSTLRKASAWFWSFLFIFCVSWGMSEFGDCERKFKSTISDVDNSIARLAKMNKEDRRVAVNHINNELSGCERFLQQMEGIARRDPGKAMEYQGPIRKCNSELARVKGDLSRAKNAQFFNDRDDLFNSPDDLQDWSRDQRGRLLDQNRRLDNATDRLTNTQQVAQESEDIGQSTLEMLVGQRGQIESANRGLDDIDANMTKTRKILRQMYFRVLSNKIVLGILIAAELITIVVLFYLKFFA